MCRCKHTSLVYVLLNFHLSIFWAFVNRIIFLISMFKCSLLVYKMQLIFARLSYNLWPCWTYLLVLGSFYFMPFYVDNHAMCKYTFVSPFCISMPFISISCLVTQVKTFITQLNKSGENGHFFSVLRGKHCIL